VKIAQFLLTRFNSAVSFAPEDAGIDSAWLRHRFQLFERICLPSVASQIDADFHWILLVSDRTPHPWVARLLGNLEKTPSPALILLVKESSEEHFASAILKLMEHERADRVVSTRLDNDDAIARDYLAEVRREASKLPDKGHYVINFRNGFQAARSGIFPRAARLNPFLSMVSTPGDLRTAFATHHERMGSAGIVIDKTGTGEKWVQVIHGHNAASRLRRSEPRSGTSLKNFSLARDWQSCL
jgi:NADPH-dependent ferric siderophore reductase